LKDNKMEETYVVARKM